MRALAIISFMFFSTLAFSQRPPFLEKIFVGGDVSPGGRSELEWLSGNVLMGYKITNEWSAGFIVPVIYEFKTEFTHYGLSPFTRYKILNQFFAHAEFENISLELPNDDRFLSQALFVGGGISQPLRGNISFSLSALYNLLYDDEASPRIYTRPFVIRGGVNLGF